jgi:hypothetical protein
MVTGFQDELDSDDEFVSTHIASDDSDLDNDNVQDSVDSNIKMKQNDSDVKHSKETDSNINVIQSDDSDHDIPVTKDESDIEKNVTTAVTVAADDSDIEENVNTQVTVAADDSDIEDDVNTQVTVAIDKDISEDEMNSAQKIETTSIHQNTNSEADISQQPDFGDWLDQLESKVFICRLEF